MSKQELLRRLGAGESVASVSEAEGVSPDAFASWWKAEARSRLPEVDGTRRAPVRRPVEIIRDEWGIPHVFGNSDDDLFFGFGYAMAQDRLWQMDYLRRKAMGRLAEILGPEGIDLDVIARTVGLHRIAVREVENLPPETLRLLKRFSAGVNAVIDESRERPPIEFDLLDYRPHTWSPIDCIAILGEFRWYLTGRLPVIAIPELAKRVLGSGPLYEALLISEAGDESIVPAGSYLPSPRGEERVGEAVGDPQGGIGSNNWAVSGALTAGSKPMVASDPHIAFGSVSCWYEVRLSGGSFNVTGMAYAGVPAVLFGRNERVAWGITNNICSQRDLYQERTDPGHPGCFLYDGAWEPARERVEEIAVRGGETLRKTVRLSRNGPMVDELLPRPVQNTGPVSLRWLGTRCGDELSCMLTADRARSCDEFRECLGPWRVPTWSFVFADVEDHVGYQCVGRIPIRKGWDRGYRPGWEPAHQWQGLVPFEGMPSLADPPRGWIASANNRTAPEDYPYPLSGTWGAGWRALRIRNLIEEGQGRFTRQDFERMQLDVLSLRAAEGVPKLLEVLRSPVGGASGDAASPSSGLPDEWADQAIGYLQAWDCRMQPNSVPAAIFEVFFQHWCEAVAAERFERQAAAVVAGTNAGWAMELLSEDRAGWFAKRDRIDAIRATFQQALKDLGARLGPDTSAWHWGRLHRITLRHALTQFARWSHLAPLLDRGNEPVGGNGVTVCNTTPGLDYQVTAGANYRLIADLSESPAGLWAVDAAGQSGHPGSPHYGDQLREWLRGGYHYLPLASERVKSSAESRLVLRPARL